MRGRIVLGIGAWVLLCGCDPSVSCSTSVGTCNEASTQCGVELRCDDDVPRRLGCAPDGKQGDLHCRCIESGRVIRKVTVATPLPAELESAKKLTAQRCGWDVH